MGNAHAIGVMETKHVCQNCGKKFGWNDLKTFQDIFQRVSPGEPMPSGECPDCGAACLPEYLPDWERIICNLLESKKDELPTLMGIDDELDELIARALKEK